jgi:hypothetical protein
MSLEKSISGSLATEWAAIRAASNGAYFMLAPRQEFPYLEIGTTVPSRFRQEGHYCL